MLYPTRARCGVKSSISSIAQGEHPKVIQARLGHASIKTTLDTYGHLFDGLDEAAADRLDETWRASAVDSLWTRADSRVVDFSSR